MKRLISVFLVFAMMIPLSLGVSANNAEFDIVKTDIKADSVVNYDGYGSLEIYGGKDAELGVFDVYSHGVIGADGEMVIPYMETGRHFMYSAGIFSLSSGSVYKYGGNPEYREEPTSYYGLDGKEIDLYSMLNKERLFGEEKVSSDGIEYTYDYSFKSSPMTDGIAVLIADRREYANGGDDGYKYDRAAFLIDRDGDVRARLPEAFAEPLMAADMWIEYREKLGLYKEGLIAHYEYLEPEQYRYEFIVWGYMNEVGETVLDLSDRGYEDLWEMYEGMAIFRGANGKLGYIDDGGVEIVPAIYDNASEFCDGMAYVKKDGKYGAIDKEGNVVIPLEYEVSYGTGEGYMTVGENGKFGIVDTDGNYVIPLEYDDITPFRGGVAYAIKDGYVYIITEKEAPEVNFTDVPEREYYAEPVAWAVKNGITNGMTLTEFGPHYTCKNEQIITFLWRAYGCPEPTVENPFTDVNESHYYYKPALWAYEMGMVKGDVFGGSAPCTRAMTVMYLWQAAGAPETEPTEVFSDVPTDAEFAPAVAWAFENGITDGTSPTTFTPDGTCTRAQIVTFLWRNLGK